MSTCEQCDREFKSGAAFTNHKKFAHGEQIVLTCDSCGIKFSNTKALQNHRRVHASETTGAYKCPACDSYFIHQYVLMSHMEFEHDELLEVMNYKFESMEEFLEWKEEMERCTKSNFVQNRGVVKTRLGTSITFVCHRSGLYKPSLRNSRVRKSQVSNKIGFCPARIKVKVIDKEVSVEFLSTHLGHTMDVNRLALTPKDRIMIANKIANKVPFDDILNQVRDSISDEGLSRIHLIQKRDLYNIAASYKLQDEAVKYRAEYTNLEDWVREIESSSNIIRLFKAQGTVLSTYPSLKSDDFVLIMSDDIQLKHFCDYGRTLICIDGNQGSGEFFLYCLSVVDGNLQPFPCAFIFTNRVDITALTIYFSVIIDSLSTSVVPLYFMSSLNDILYEAWCTANRDKSTKQLYCPWYVDRDWRTSISSIPCREKQTEVYKSLKMITVERESSRFMAMSQSVLNQLSLDKDTGCFGRYLSERVEKASAWAYCHSVDVLHLHKPLEIMHRTLEFLYNGCKRMHKYDRAIHVVMNFLREQVLEWRMYQTEHRINHRVNEIAARHKASLKWDTRRVSPRTDKRGWVITSSRGDLCHVASASLTCSCPIRCPDCKFCIHAFICTCSDSSVRWIMCKHIHLIGRWVRENQQTEEQAVVPGSQLVILLNDTESELKLIAPDNGEVFGECSDLIENQSDADETTVIKVDPQSLCMAQDNDQEVVHYFIEEEEEEAVSNFLELEDGVSNDIEIFVEDSPPILELNDEAEVTNEFIMEENENVIEIMEPHDDELVQIVHGSEENGALQVIDDSNTIEIVSEEYSDEKSGHFIEASDDELFEVTIKDDDDEDNSNQKSSSEDLVVLINGNKLNTVLENLTGVQAAMEQLRQVLTNSSVPVSELPNASPVCDQNNVQVGAEEVKEKLKFATFVPEKKRRKLN